MPPARPAREQLKSVGKHEVAMHLLRAAETEGLGLCVWRGLASGATQAGFDVDLVAPARPWQAYEPFIGRALTEVGWRVIICAKHGQRLTCLTARGNAVPGEEDGFLELDVHTSLTAGGIPFARLGELLTRSEVVDGVRRLNSTDATVTTYLEGLLAHGEPKERYQAEFRAALARDPDRARRLVVAAVGHRLGEGVLRGDENAPSFRELRRVLRRRALVTRPGATFRVMLSKVRDLAAAYRRPPGRMWTFSGPDGAGKSSVIEALEPLVARRLLLGVRRFHSRPFLIPRLSKVVPMPRERSEKILRERLYEPRIGVLKSAVRLLVTLADYVLGYWVKVRPRLCRGELVIFDRYMQDLLVDPRLRGIALPQCVLDAAARLVPKGEVHVYVVVDAETLVQRKGELTLTEAQHQLDRYAALAATDARGLLLDSRTAAPETLAERLAARLLTGRPAAGVAQTSVAP